MSAIIQLLALHGFMLLSGATALMLVGAGAAFFVRSPVHRQRVCELCIVASLAWIVLAAVPLPRMNIERHQATAPPVQHGQSKAPIELFQIPPELIAKSKVPHLTARPAPIQPMPKSPSRSIDPRVAMASVYIAGVAICMGWLMLGYLLLWRTLRRSNPAPAQVLEMVDAACWRRHRRLRVLISPGTGRPVTCGVFRPTILLPESLLQHNRQSQLRQALLHEVGHVQQRDGLGALLFNIALPLLYFHPLYWLLRRTSNLARELVVDDWAAQADGKETYVAQLIALAREHAGRSISPLGAIGILQTRSHFYRRMHMLLHRNESLAMRCSNVCRVMMASLALTIVIGAASLTGVRPAMAQNPPGAKDADTNNRAVNERAAADQIDALKAENQSLHSELEKLKQLQYQGAAAKPVAPQDTGIIADTAKAVDSLSDAQIGMIDQYMRRLLADRDETRLEFEKARTTYGPAHVKVKTLEAALNESNKRIDAYSLEWREMQKKLGNANSVFATRRAPDANAALATPDAARVGGVQLDLVQLGNSLVDAAGAAQLAMVKLKVADAIRKDGAKNELEYETARVNYETADKRLKLLRDIASIALRSAQNDLNLATDKYKKGFQTSESLSDATSKVQMLEAIIGAAK